MTLKSKCGVLKDLFIRQVCECEGAIFTARKQSLRRLFSQASVILSTGGCAWQGGHVWQECVGGRGGMHGGERGMHGKGACVGSVHSGGGGMYAKEMATAVGGKHPTGMHSCLCLPSVNVKAALHLRRTCC